MKGFITALLLFLLLFSVGNGLAGDLPAVTTVQGTIYWLGGSPVGEFNEWENNTVNTVDYIYFTVNSPGTITIDVLSFELNDADWSWVDVNGDGEVAFLDSYIRLFRDDGSLGTDDQIAYNDDSSSTFGDGSIESYDSYLSLDFTADDLATGDSFVLAISNYSLSLNSAVAGVNSSSFGPWTQDFFQSDHGDYRVTFTGEVTVTIQIEDADEDGVADEDDNCPNDPNADQADFDGDGTGDVCDVVGDLDGNDYISQSDLQVLFSYVGKTTAECSACDINGDGSVNVIDVRQLIMENPSLSRDRMARRTARRSSRRNSR